VVEDSPEPDALSDDALVVRGGVMASEQLRLNAEDHNIENLEDGIADQWAISVFAAGGLSAGEICRAAAIPHPKVRVSTVGLVRSLGYDVIPRTTCMRISS
jgi:hypothetical protein